MGRRARRRGRGTFLSFILLLSAIAAAAAFLYAELAVPSAVPPAPAAEGTLRMHYVNVGQGDGTIWELPDGSVVIYDCGPPARDAEANRMVRYLRDTLGRAPGTRLAALVTSHGHLDHIGGCEEILSTYDFGMLVDQGYEGADAPASYTRHRKDLAGEPTPLTTLATLHPGDLLPFASVRTTLLWPPAFAPGGWDAIAEASLVLRVEHGSRAFCFQGDIETRQEASLEGRCDVYLVGHHGSRYASSEAWLARMGPAVAVVSHGENSYGHPHPEALCRIWGAGAEVHATPGVDAVIVETDGESIRVIQPARLQPAGCTS